MYQKGNLKGMIRFSIKPEAKAKTVQLAGDFSNWAPVPMKRHKDGLYVAKVPTGCGTYEYKFIVDGQWVADPENTDRKANRFGTENSVASIP